MQGFDAASFQGTIDFDRLTATDRHSESAIGFALFKATEGVGFTDPTFARNWTEAKRVGLVRGAYHFARPDLGNAPHDEARYFLSTIAPLAAGDVLALDYEVATANADEWCAEFLAFVRDAVGVVPLLYLNLNLIRTVDWSRSIATGAGLWLALYDGAPEGVPDELPWPVVAMKQYTSAGSLSGIAYRVDLDTFYGDRAQLIAYGIKKEATMDTPQRMGQSADLTIKVGELGTLQGIYAYPAHPEGRAIVWKVRGTRVGRTVIVMYPPVDPDADATMLLAAEPCIFIVDVLP